MSKHIFNVQVATLKGNARSKNEDNFFVEKIMRSKEDQVESFEFDSQEGIVAAVCDGMGGEAYGEKASQIVVDKLCHYSSRIKSAADDKVSDVVNEFINDANKEICEMADKLCGGISGSTIALACIKNDKVFVFNSGDSRGYFFSNGTLEKITEDQTLATLKVRSKIYSEKEAEKSNDRHKLVSFVGCDSRKLGMKALEYPSFDISDGTILLCSDGLTSFIDKCEIADKLNCRANENTAEALVNIADSNGSCDNITCILISRQQKK